MALHLSSLEVSSLDAGRFSDLHPLSGIAELRKDGRKWDNPRETLGRGSWSSRSYLGVRQW
jgi:hypothetical protein